MILCVRSSLWGYHYVTIDHWPLTTTLNSKISKFKWNLGWVVPGLDKKSSYYLVLTGGGGVGTQDVEDFPLSEHRFLHLTTDPPPDGRGLSIVQLIITPSAKQETGNFRGIVYFLFLISIKLSLKWALVETSMTKLIFLCLIAWSKSRRSTKNFWQKKFLSDLQNIDIKFFVWILSIKKNYSKNYL